MRGFFKAYRDILVYHDYGPLLLFWNIADLANNRVLWMSYGEALWVWIYVKMRVEVMHKDLRG
jgi:hypothetical protein